MPNLSDYDPAVKYGANLDVNVDLADIRDANNNELLELDTVASAVNNLSIDNAITGDGPTVSAVGDDTNVPLYLTSKGTGSVTIYTGASAREVLVLNNTASAVNHLDVTPAATGSNPALAAVGDDTNISLQLSGKGTAVVLVGDSGTGTVNTGSVTINAQRGVITSDSYTTGTAASTDFDFRNNRLLSTSRLILTINGGTNTTGLPVLGLSTVGAGSATVRVTNADSRPGGAALNGNLKLSFIVL